MLKLTIRKSENHLRPSTAKADVYISPRHISAMEIGEGYTVIRTPTYTYMVEETVEQIMAMPEMLYEMHPAMVLSNVNDYNGYSQR